MTAEDGTNLFADLNAIKTAELSYSLTPAVDGTELTTNYWVLSVMLDGVAVGSTDLNWSVDPFDIIGVSDPRSEYEMTPFGITNDLSSLTSSDTVLTTSASIMFSRIAEIISTDAVEVITGARDGDIFVLKGGDDLITGGIGSDRYEVRILEQSNGTAVSGNYTINELGRITEGNEEDTVLIEGARDLGDLSFTRTEVASEESDATLNIGYNQFRGVDNVGEGISSGDSHASGQITLFNQFSTSQSSIYQVEKIQIGAEHDAENSADPFAMAVQTYYIADSLADTSVSDLTTTVVTGDVLSASADVDSIMIGEGNAVDVFEINAPTSSSAASGDGLIAADHQEVYIYGMVQAGGTSIDNDEIIIKTNLSTSTALSDPIGTGLSGTLFSGAIAYEVMSDGAFEDGGDFAHIKFEFAGEDNDLSAFADNTFLDLYLEDAGNIDSQTLLDRIRWET